MSGKFQSLFSQRLLRQLLIFGIPIVFLTGGGLWYHYNFPIPRLLVHPQDPFSHGKLDWLIPYQDRLVRWKFDQLTPRVKLAGTRWRDPRSGAECEFGKDGTFRWVQTLEPPDHPFFNLDGYRLAKEVEGSAFVFHPERRGFYWNAFENSRSWNQSNLEFPNQPWNGFIGYDGKHLGFCVSHNDQGLGIDRSFSIIFTERVK